MKLYFIFLIACVLLGAALGKRVNRPYVSVTSNSYGAPFSQPDVQQGHASFRSQHRLSSQARDRRRCPFFPSRNASPCPRSQTRQARRLWLTSHHCEVEIFCTNNSDKCSTIYHIWKLMSAVLWGTVNTHNCDDQRTCCVRETARDLFIRIAVIPD